MKRLLTLTEVLIAFALTAVLIATLMGTLTRTVTVQKKLTSAKSAITKRATLHQRLSYVFANSKDIEVTENDLKMILQNGYDHDPLYRKECPVVIRHNVHKKCLELSFSKDRVEHLCSCDYITWEFFPDDEHKQWVTLTIDGKTQYPFYLSSPPLGRELL